MKNFFLLIFALSITCIFNICKAALYNTSSSSYQNDVNNKLPDNKASLTSHSSSTHSSASSSPSSRIDYKALVEKAKTYKKAVKKLNDASINLDNNSLEYNEEMIKKILKDTKEELKVKEITSLKSDNLSNNIDEKQQDINQDTSKEKPVLDKQGDATIDSSIKQDTTEKKSNNEPSTSYLQNQLDAVTNFIKSRK